MGILHLKWNEVEMNYFMIYSVKWCSVAYIVMSFKILMSLTLQRNFWPFGSFYFLVIYYHKSYIYIYMFIQGKERGFELVIYVS